MIPQSFIQDLLGRVDIVDVIERDVPLRKAGANYTACCPFHSEKTASFTVAPAKQFYHCFGCGAHGNAIGFVMEHGGMSFVEAIHDLAGRVGMQVPVQEPAFPSRGGDKSPTENSAIGHAGHSLERLLEAVDVAARYYREQLRRSERAISYLKQRGMTGETAARFAIGYAPAGWRGLEAAFPDYAAASRSSQLAAAGLVVESGEGGRYDRFRDRIMFPILDLKGRIVAFGGRVLEQGEPKYLNSPETPLFQKGRELYNLFAARRAIREAGRVVVVEGYMDVVALAQHGIGYAVAALGTAVTAFHIQKLLRHADIVVFCFDGDKAGRKAAWRALEESLAQLQDGKQVSFLFLPEGEDPDSYVRKAGRKAFEGLLDQALPLSVFLLRELEARTDLTTSEGRARLVRDAKPLLTRLVAPGLTLMLLKQLAEISGTSQGELEDLLKIRRPAFPSSREKAPRPRPASPQHWLIQILMHDPGYARKLDRALLAQQFGHAEEGALRALVEFIDAHPHLEKERVVPSAIVYFQDSPHRSLIYKTQSETLAWDDGIDLEAEFTGALARLREMHRKQRMASLHSRPLSTLTAEEKRELQRLALLS
ncbi:DNA primase [Nitrosovibrio sp. Nv17]|uniref:DNA primase n=1 Tax=Nitrosovibrio sp. Nv17 TaxID=1855339 RepID=UPI0009085B49|nr:DNA primase [Nitrosovibrio sp. Nv17]SFW28706.1 DNA primase [Nitrosovibrio sp. Nv17]